MTDRPMIFSGPMIRALQDGRKTQTRRVIKPQPPEGARYTGVHFASDEPDCWFFNSPRGPFKVRQAFEEGDRLWVREGFAGGRPGVANVIYRANHEENRGRGPRVDMPWRSPIHMPRWASRLTLTVTAARVERLQDISEENSRAEGCGWQDAGQDSHLLVGDSVGVFARLWQELHGPDAWSANPWVAAGSFTVDRRNIDAVASAGAAA